MSLTLTLFILGLAMLAAVGANWLERRPHASGNPPLVPWTVVQIIAIVVIILMLAHLVSLLSGQPLEGRFSR